MDRQFYKDQFYYSSNKPDASMLESGLSTVDYTENNIEKDVDILSGNDDWLIGKFEPRDEEIWILKVNKKVSLLDLSTMEKLDKFFKNERNLFKYTGRVVERGSVIYQFITFDFDEIRRKYDGVFIDKRHLHYFSSKKLILDEKFRFINEGTVWFNWVFDDPVYKTVIINNKEEALDISEDPSNIEKLISEVKKQERKLQHLSVESLKEKAEKVNKYPGKINTHSEWYKRSPEVRLYAKVSANGICQLCEQLAPFKDKEDIPYLEVHHIKWLSKGGADTIENTVALCPNCHRKMHSLNLEEDIDKLKKIAELSRFT